MSTSRQAADVIVGIDLGTTNSAVAVYRNGRIDIVAEDGNELLPSCVALTEDGNLIVGEEARNQLVVHPERTVRSVKREMGSSETISLGERDFSPTEISAMILRELKGRAERFLGSEATQAVITVPAYFSDAQRQATRDAGAMAGLDVLRIVNEPTAACLAYETHEATSSRKILAYDFGGGTFDVSIVNMEEDLVEVTGSHGDTHLGGDDIDETIVERLLGELAVDKNDADDIALTAVAKNRLRRAAETAKIRLSEQTHVRVIEENLETESGERLHLDTELSRQDLADLARPFLDRTINSARQALTSAGITPSEIDEVLLVGGSTRMTAVSDRLQQEFGRRPRADVHPDLAVVYGAGVMAARLMGQQNQRILVDITPYTFGTAALGYLNNEYCPYVYCPVIRAGTPLPAKRSEVFYTNVDGQRCVRVTIFEGENKDARRNILIGQFMIEGLDEDEPAGSEIVLSMELDLDGILRVTATEKATGLSKDIVIEKTLDKVSDEDIKSSKTEIEKLFGDAVTVGADETDDLEEIDIPQEDDEEHELRRRARQLLRRLRESRPRMDEVDREDANQLAEKLREALEENDEEAMQDAITEADDLLFYVDSTT